MPEQPSNSSKLKRYTLLTFVALLPGALVLLILWLTSPDLESWNELLTKIYAYLEANPWVLVLALATLPGIGFPISPLFITVGAVLGPKYGLPTACLIAIAAQSTCTIWTYLLAAGPLKNSLRKYIAKKRSIPEFSESNTLRFAIIMRITPGIPYALQNIVLGIIGLKTKPYLLVSLPITALWTIGFVTTGGAIFNGSAGLAITGGLLLVILITVTRMLSNRTQNDAG